jgi:hypothetical protein
MVLMPGCSTTLEGKPEAATAMESGTPQSVSRIGGFGV